MNYIKICVLTIALCLSACSTSSDADAGNSSNKPIIECADPRPQICTREYMPVCATESTGIVCVTTPCPSTEEVSYSNACTACAEPKVRHYSAGSCDN